MSVTRTRNTSNSVISQFVSKDDLIKAITASAFIPFFSGVRPIHMRNQGLLDGGLSSNLLNIFRNTITVSPFAGSAHISPVDHAKTREWEVVRYNFADQGSDITVSNIKRLQNVLYPPDADALGKLMEEGFRDGHRFLRRYGIASCSQCLTIRSNIRPKSEPVNQEQALRNQVRANQCRDKIECDKYHVSTSQMSCHYKKCIAIVLSLGEEY